MLPDTHNLGNVARHPPFGEGNSNCRQSLRVWVSGTPLGVWNPSGTPRFESRPTGARVGNVAKTPTFWECCQTPTIGNVARHPPFWNVARHPPFGEGNSNCRQSLRVWASGTPRSSVGVWNPLNVARHPPFGEGNSNCRQSLRVWASGTPRSSVGVWNPSVSGTPRFSPFGQGNSNCRQSLRVWGVWVSGTLGECGCLEPSGTLRPPYESPVPARSAVTPAGDASPGL